MISEKFDISARLCFRVHDADIHGGEGSIGYSSVTYMHIEAPELLNDQAAETARAYTADAMGVPVNNVEIIDYETYEKETENSFMEDDLIDEENFME